MKKDGRLVLMLCSTCFILSAGAMASWSAEAWLDRAGVEREAGLRGRAAVLAKSASVHREEGFALEAAGETISGGRFKEILEQVVGEGDGSSDLSAAATGYQFAVCHRVESRDSADEEFQDYRGKGTRCSVVVPALMALDIYWAGNFNDAGQAMSRMESFYLFNLKVSDRTLRWHQILSDMSWVKGNPPLGREMDVVGHEAHRLEAGGKEVSTRMIGTREFRITVGFFSRPTPP
ncbi:MAG: hypothetical protein HZB91_14235 [Elusimicrobia bacterium]|nr:hypothetical protein [Elusimicrobiota bacterium]